MSCCSLRSLVSPGQLILLSILAAICMGTAALSLSYAQVKPIPMIDCFFTATSTVCVTGLTTAPFSDFTPFGQWILLILMQIGGLGLITITLFFMYVLLNVGLSGSVIASKILEIDSWRDVRYMIIMITLFTLFCELLGTLCIYMLVRDTNPDYEGFFFALFHSVSAFCNAGIVLPSAIAVQYSNSKIVLTILALLVWSGGLGFFTWYEIGKMVYNRAHHKRFRFSLHTALTLKMSLGIIGVTTLVYFFLERAHTLATESLYSGSFIALFHAISFRSAGFLIGPTIFMLQPATILLLFVVAFIGSGAGSTGSGIKITTFTILYATIKSVIMGRDQVEIAHRTIPYDQVCKVGSIVALSLIWVLLSTFILLITETNYTFGDLLLESISAFSCVAVDLTPSLSQAGKMVLMASMIAGRIGPLTLLLSLKMHRRTDAAGFSYPEERVLLG